MGANGGQQSRTAAMAMARFVCIGAEAEGATGVALGMVQERPGAERV
jgi:hypothetical protein